MVYLDNAATTFPKPRGVIKALADSAKIYGGNPGRSGHKASMKTAEMIYNTRIAAAKMFGTTSENIIFTQNCTHALNLAIKGVVHQSDHLIISNLEHNSVLRPVHALSMSGRATYSSAVISPGNPKKTAAYFERLIQKNTRAIICTHASNVTGDVFPIKEISEVAQYYKVLLIIDAAQTAGVLPIDMQQTGIDILCCAGHKGLYGPPGTGMLVLGHDNIKLSTLIEGGTGSNSIEFKQPEFVPDRYESGTLNTVGIYALGEGMKFVGSLGTEKIYNHEIGLTDRCAEAMKKLGNIILYGMYGESQNLTDSLAKRVPVLSFNIDGLESGETARRLSEMDIAVRAGLHCSPLAHQHLKTLESGTVRVSPGVFNTSHDIDYFISCVKKIKVRAIS
ncbi:MAG: aminotransferase class V-fold PLP-dependent enzyme [Oscillospiraceae bacterium]|nr:aminotransferase class V-fold PLP-dependent enzyme [Oscillospiraceae bacterium]